jgi:tyrosyl-tRNA synthetase
MIKLAAQATAAQILQREDFANRMANDVPISLHELLYPLVQAYDSWAIDADIEFGGTDQLFNNLMGRHLQERWGKAGQIVMVMPLLRGLDGVDKMSKSKHNYIGITEAPEDMYGKAMSIPDALLAEWATLATDWGDSQRKAMLADIAVQPMDVKKAIAANIVTQYHDAAAAERAAQHFYNNVQNRDVMAKDYETRNVASLGLAAPLTLLDVCRALEPDMTGGDLKRLIAGGGVAVNGTKADNAQAVLQTPFKIKIGKRGFYEVV